MFWLWPGHKEHRVKRQLSAYLDGKLSNGEKRLVEEHLTTCPACREELRSLSATVEALRRLPSVVPPRSFAITARAAQPRPTAGPVLRLATAVSILLLLLVSAGDLLRLYPTQAEAPPAREELGALRQAAAPPLPLSTPAPLKSRIAGDVQGEEKTMAAAPPPAPAPTPAPTLATPRQERPITAYAWPVRQVEFYLAGASLILAALSLFLWKRGKRRAIRPKYERR